MRKPTGLRVAVAVWKRQQMLDGVRVTLLIGLTCFGTAAGAQQRSPVQAPPQAAAALPQQVSPNKASPLLLQADDLVYDNKNHRVVARGNVELYQDENVLLADEVVYDKRANTLMAIGNVRLKEADGSVVNADRLTLQSNFRDGFVRSLRALTQDDTRIAASNAYKKGNQTVYEKTVVTSCKPCEADPDRPPVWRVKATRVIEDRDDQNIYFENATFELWGVPVAWVPYFYVPDYNVKQREGFLTPQYAYHSSTVGYAVSLPYFYPISPSTDLTLTPTFTTQAGYMLEADWRQRLWNGFYEIKAYGAYNDQADDFFGNRNWRGSVESQGSFQIASAWTFGWNAILESDYTFRRFYDIDSIYANERTSTVYLTGMWDRSYFNISVNRYGNLLGEQTYIYETNSYLKSVNAWSYPVIDYNYVHNKPVLGGEFSFNLNAVALQVNDPINQFSKFTLSNSDHVSADVQWRRTFKDDIGEVFTPFAMARGDVYSVSDFVTPTTSGLEDTFTRQMVGVGLDYRYPFVASSGGVTQVVEPVAQIISRAGGAENNKVPNNDAQSLVFDDTLLFDINKFSGYDQIETGTRTNFGLQYTAQASNGLSVRTVGGESIQLTGKNPYALYYGSGLETTRSDYVTGMYVDYRNLFRLTGQVRFDESTLQTDYQSFSFQAKLGWLQGGVGYENVAPTIYYTTRREEISGFGAVKLNDEWTVFGDSRYDIELGEFIRYSGGVQWADDCYIVSLTYARTNVTIGDINPATSVLLRIGIKGFGQQTAPSSLYDLSPEAQAANFR